MIEIIQDWVYEWEACDCCEGYWEPRWEVKVDGEHQSYFTDKSQAQAFVLECLNPPNVHYYESDCPDDD